MTSSQPRGADDPPVSATEASAAPISVAALLESLHEFAWVVDARKRFVAFNSPLREYLLQQFGTAMMPGMSTSDVVPLERARSFDALYARALSGGGFTAEWQLADGRTIEIAFNPILHDGAPVAVACFAQDVTGRHRTEEALRRSEAKFRAVVDNSHDGILFGDASARITYRSPSYKRINGYDDDERVGHSGYETVHPDDLAGVRQVWEDLVRRPGGSATHEYRIRHKDGSWRAIEITVQNLLANPSVGEMVVVARDVTERKRAEAERDRLRETLFQAQKMEAIGTLAGGVAHDFNNILGGLLGGLALLELEPGLTPAIADEVRNLKGLVQRGADLAQQLLGFARRGKYEVQPVDVASTVSSTCSMFGRTRRDLVVDASFADGLPAALVDPTQLHQVVLNLLVNAGHAMQDGGKIGVRVDRVELAKVDAEPHGAKPGPFVRISVRDTGVGIDAATLPHIFEPFFTTRAPGEGTGLGLASVYGIVRGHGGVVRVESEVGAGSTFTVLFPASPLPPPASAAAPPVDSSPGRGTVLVIDDEEAMRRIYERMLRRIGFHVIAAADGERGLELLREHIAGVVLVVLDMTMPGLSGAETFRRVRAMAPDAPVLLASGFSPDQLAKDVLAHPGTAFVQKPFDFKALAAKVGELTERPRGA